MSSQNQAPFSESFSERREQAQSIQCTARRKGTLPEERKKKKKILAEQTCKVYLPAFVLGFSSTLTLNLVSSEAQVIISNCVKSMEWNYKPIIIIVLFKLKFLNVIHIFFRFAFIKKTESKSVVLTMIKLRLLIKKQRHTSTTNCRQQWTGIQHLGKSINKLLIIITNHSLIFLIKLPIYDSVKYLRREIICKCRN